MWPRSSHTLAPLTKKNSNKRKSKWTKIKQDAFYGIKKLEVHDNLLIYPNFNKTFKIHTNASNLELGVVIRHKEKLIAFHSIKLTDVQKKYTATER